VIEAMVKLGCLKREAQRKTKKQQYRDKYQADSFHGQWSGSFY